MHSCMKHSVTAALTIVKQEIFNWTFGKRGQQKIFIILRFQKFKRYFIDFCLPSTIKPFWPHFIL